MTGDGCEDYIYSRVKLGRIYVCQEEGDGEDGVDAPNICLGVFSPVLLLFVPVRFLLYIPYSPVASRNGLGITRRQEGVDECAVIRRGGSRAAIVRSMISRKQVLQVYHREKREKRELDFVHRSPFSGIIGFLRSGNAYEGSQPKLMLHICRMANTI